VADDVHSVEEVLHRVEVGDVVGGWVMGGWGVGVVWVGAVGSGEVGLGEVGVEDDDVVVLFGQSVGDV
jgi:hypothetical protein